MAHAQAQGWHVGRTDMGARTQAALAGRNWFVAIASTPTYVIPVVAMEPGGTAVNCNFECTPRRSLMTADSFTEGGPYDLPLPLTWANI